MKDEVYHQYASALSDDHWWVAHRRSIFSTWLGAAGVLPDSRKRVLELGCGVGIEWPFLGKYGPVTGVELSETGLAYCQNLPYSRLVNADINTYDFGAEEFELAVDFHVLYHSWIADPGEVLARLHRALKPGGHLLLTEPAFRILKRSHDDVVMAARRWNRQELVSLVESAGFTVTHCSAFLLPVAPIALLLAGLDRMRPDAEDIKELKKGSSVAEALLKALLAVERAILRRGSLPIGTCWAILARKGSGAPPLEAA